VVIFRRLTSEGAIVRKSILTALCLALALVTTAVPASAATINFNIVVNTAPLMAIPGAGPFYLDFQLIGAGPNALLVNGFDFGGGTLVGAPTLVGGAGGSLGSGVTLNDSGSFLNEFFQAFTPGTSLRFSVTTTTNLTPTPDAFSFSILDGTLSNIPTNGLGDSLVFLTLGPNNTLRDIQTAHGLSLPGGPAYANVGAQVVPEPATLALLVTGLAAAVRRRATARR
jgi:hypothetical protein